MSADDTKDVLVDGIRFFLRDEVNHALRHEVDSTIPVDFKPVARTMGFPIQTHQLTQGDTPLISVCRVRSSVELHGKKSHRRTVLKICYWCDTTPMRKLDDRWPILHRVWEAAVDRMLGSESLAEEIGLVSWEENSFYVDYKFARTSDSIYPYFESNIELVHLPLTPGAQVEDGYPLLRIDACITSGEHQVDTHNHILNIIPDDEIILDDIDD